MRAHKLVLAVDGSRCGDAVVDAVIAQFQPSFVEIRVIHVLEWPQVLPRPLGFAEGPAAAEAVLDAENARRDYGWALVRRAVDRLRQADFAATGFVVEGAARASIVAVAASWPADIIVVGSHSRHGLDRALLGSVSEGILRHAPCSVYVVRERVRRPIESDSSLLSSVNQEGVPS